MQDVVDVEEIRKNVEKMNQGKFIFNKFCVWSYNQPTQSLFSSLYHPVFITQSLVLLYIILILENQEAEESDIERKLRLLAEKRRSGEIESEFRHLTAMNEMINIENIQELFAVKIGEFKHNFLTLQTPESTGMILTKAKLPLNPYSR